MQLSRSPAQHSALRRTAGPYLRHQVRVSAARHPGPWPEPWIERACELRRNDPIPSIHISPRNGPRGEKRVYRGTPSTRAKTLGNSAQSDGAHELKETVKRELSDG